MTGEEFAQFVLEVNATFRGDKIGPVSGGDVLGAARDTAYRVHLGGLDYGTAQAAIRLLLEDGQVFVPAVAEVLAAARRTSEPRTPSWLEAWPLIERSLRRDDPDLLPDVVREFVVHYGSHRLGHEPVNDPVHGGAVLARIGKDFDRFVEDYRDGQRIGRALDPVSRGQLRRMSEDSLGRKRLAAAAERADSAGPTDDER